jgi:hypothetical protein
MTISLYDISVRGFLQTLDAVSGYLDKGLAHCREHGIDPETIVETSLFHDMRPFRFQIQLAVHHSLGAAEAMKSGTFLPPHDLPAHDYAGLQALVADARSALSATSEAEIDARLGADVVFKARGMERVFTAEGFVMSFSIPNFHFHATTAYDILRTKGVPLGKRHYLGKMRMKA